MSGTILYELSMSSSTTLNIRLLSIFLSFKNTWLPYDHGMCSVARLCHRWKNYNKIWTEYLITSSSGWVCGAEQVGLSRAVFTRSCSPYTWIISSLITECKSGNFPNMTNVLSKVSLSEGQLCHVVLQLLSNDHGRTGRRYRDAEVRDGASV